MASNTKKASLILDNMVWQKKLPKSQLKQRESRSVMIAT
jgi:hypothetical protein